MERVKDYINCVIDANIRLRNVYMIECEKHSSYEQENIINESTIMQWVQMWGSTACGFGGIGGAAMTNADTIIVEFSEYKVACVYHSGRFAYSCMTDDSYRAYVNFRSFPGKADAEEGNWNFEGNSLELVDMYKWKKEK